MLELAWTQNIQQNDRTEGAQGYASPSAAETNEVARLACHIGRRDKHTSRKYTWSKAAASSLRKGNLSMTPNLTNLLMKRVKEGNLPLLNPD